MKVLNGRNFIRVFLIKSQMLLQRLKFWQCHKIRLNGFPSFECLDQKDNIIYLETTKFDKTSFRSSLWRTAVENPLNFERW